jgi:AcrR family transcriptional regulator
MTKIASGASTATPQLDWKSIPSRRNGKDTIEIILATAGELLAETGFERLTTNLVCERAGMTPPALYRYFPNKYALLAELARRLMDAQDEVFFAWVKTGGPLSDTLEQAVQRTASLRKKLITVTREHPGGLWILRAIRAIPALQEVRIESRDKVLDRHFQLLRTAYPQVPPERLKTAVRLSEQMAYAVIEMMVEDPELDEDQVVEEAAWMTSLYFKSIDQRRFAETQDQPETPKPKRPRRRGKTAET